MVSLHTLSSRMRNTSLTLPMNKGASPAVHCTMHIHGTVCGRSIMAQCVVCSSWYSVWSVHHGTVCGLSIMVQRVVCPVCGLFIMAQYVVCPVCGLSIRLVQCNLVTLHRHFSTGLYAIIWDMILEEACLHASSLTKRTCNWTVY